MPSAAYVQARLLKRIADSEHDLTVHYPPVIAPVAGTAPGAAPASPLTGPTPVPVVFTADPTPSKLPITVKCLWYSAFTAVTGLQRAERDVQMVGWVAGAEALARVSLADAALDASISAPVAPGTTIFTGAEYVTHEGQRYRVLSSLPIGAGFVKPVSLYVWLSGAVHQ